MRAVFGLFFAALCTTASADPVCIDPVKLERTTVSIARYFDDSERTERHDQITLGVQGTAWFLHERILVTVGHVTDEMLGAEWKPVTIRQETFKKRGARKPRVLETQARIVSTVPTGTPENLVIVELKDAFKGAQIPTMRYRALAKDETVLGIGYADNRLRFAPGHLFVPDAARVSDGKQMPPYVLLEMSIRNDRLVFDHGASGAPVFDCDGNVVVVINNIIMQPPLVFAGQEIRIPTSWGFPNNTAVSVSPLIDAQRKK